MKLILESQNPKLLALLEELARQLGVRINDAADNSQRDKKLMEKNKGAKSNSKEAVKALKKLAALGTFNQIKDPVAWQRELRKDRPLLGRGV